MLLRTPEGVRVLKDWGPERIGRAHHGRAPVQGEGMDLVQAAVLHKPAAPLPQPIPVQLHGNVEKLVRFLNG